jgi:hypothetical protein
MSGGAEGVGTERAAATPLATGAAALAEMRRTRRRRYVGRIDRMEVLYRVYVGAIFAALALAGLASAINEASATPSAVASLAAHAPAIIGVLVAAGLLAGLRSGARGGPLAIEAAEVQFALLAPVDRGTALRPKALAQARIGAIAGAVAGAVIGNFVFRRFPGSPVEWIAALAAFGALLPLSVLGAATLASGRRLRPRWAAALGLLLVAWSALDVARGWKTSPATMLGDLATLPLQHGSAAALAALGAAVALALFAAGLAGVGGLLLEAARRRAQLTAELRFSASVQDLRTVVLLRRQLASELPRRRPWLRLPPPRRMRGAVWRRGWESFLRWPGARVLRVSALAIAAGAVTVAAWSQAPILFALPGVLLFIAALDLVEPLAQESDHPTRRELLPLPTPLLIRRHLAAPAVALGIVVALGAVAAAAIGSDPAMALGVGAVMLVGTPLALATAAAISATNDPYEFALVQQLNYLQQGGPPFLAVASVAIPTLIAWRADRTGGAAVAAAASAEFAFLGLAWALMKVLEWRMGKRDAVKSATVGA